MMRPIFAILLAVFAQPLWAEEQSTMRFDVRLLGARVGVMTIAAIETADQYTARTRFTTAGIAGALRHMDADVSVRGRINAGVMKPGDYSEAINDGTRVTNVEVRFSPGTPRLVSGNTGSKAPPADASSLTEAIDPLTGLYVLLRDQPRDKVCDFAADIFDGHRLARIVLNQSREQGRTMICSGTYRRVAGYTQSERRSREVPISIDYVPTDNGLRAQRIKVETRYGPAVVKRR